MGLSTDILSLAVVQDSVYSSEEINQYTVRFLSRKKDAAETEIGGIEYITMETFTLRCVSLLVIVYTVTGKSGIPF